MTNRQGRRWDDYHLQPPEYQILDIGHQIIDRRGTLWKVDEMGNIASRDHPPLDSNQKIINELAVTLEGQIYHLDTKQIIKIEDYIIQFLTLEVAKMIIFAVNNEDELVRVQLRGSSATSRILLEGITHLIDYRINLDGRRLNSAIIDAINSQGQWISLTLNENLNKITKTKNHGYIGEHVHYHDNGYLLTSGHNFKILKNVDLKSIDLPEGIISIIDIKIKGVHDPKMRCILALNNRGHLYYDYCNIERLGELSPCEDNTLVTYNQEDKWIQLIPLVNDQAGLVSISGKVYIIDSNFSLTLNSYIPVEVYGYKPSMVKNAQSA